ncbi:MAG: NrtA/SsuA/CpmA family ABC transporter substrate-binding protein [Candidatus Pacebacteria bacterium]|nr:NrtA/SsuA/CpmA family ABC transporter substrate-binding protein [Candidatus Paceibacterota bacterium]
MFKNISKIKIKIIVSVVIAILAVVFLVVCYLLNSNKDNKNNVIRIGYQPYWSLHSNMIQTMKRLKLLEKRGYNPEYVSFLSGPPLNQAMVSENLDAGFGGNLPAVSLIASGAGVKIIAETVKSYRQAIIVDKEKSKEIKTVKDLAGKKIGLVVGSGSHYYFYKTLKDNGMDLKDVNLVNLAVTEQSQALLLHQIDACDPWEPWTTKIEKNGSGVIISQTEKEAGFPCYAYVRGKFVDANPKAVLAFVEAMQEALVYMQKNYDQTCGWVAEETKEEQSIIYDSSKNDKILEIGENIKPRSSTLEHLTDVGNFALSQGLIKDIPDFSKAVDTSFVDKVLKIK